MPVLQEIEKLAEQMPHAAIRHELLASAHKVRFPMADILAKIPGDTLKERAQAVGVSRQTIYVWSHERFRPGASQAEAISKLTGVPVWQIRDLEEGDDDVGGAAVKAVAKLASGGEAAQAVHGRIKRQQRRAGKRGMDDAPARGRSVRTRHKRSGG